jgi:uncharacterized protein (TIGR04551 family)
MRAIVYYTMLCCAVAGWFSSAAAQGTPTTPTKKPTAAPPGGAAVQPSAKTSPSPDAASSKAEDKASAVPAAPGVKAEPAAPAEPASAPPPEPSRNAPEPAGASGIEAQVQPPAEAGPPKTAPEVNHSLLPSLEPSAVGEAETSGGVPSPGEAGDHLARTLPESVKSQQDWTAPQPVLTLHGYYRMRGELQDNFWLGRDPIEPITHDPFTVFKPLERQAATKPIGGCGNEKTRGDGTCDISTLQFANMRLRLGPQLNLSDDVRVKMVVDMFDNMIAGTGPVSYYGKGNGSGTADDPGLSNATSGIFVSSDEPSGQTIMVRQAWAEVRRRGLGELRFGRMPNHWGLGILNNAGTGIDDDFSASVDRVMGITKIAGLYFTAAYDFIAEGLSKPNVSTGLPTDSSQLDDVDQFTFTVARQLSPEEQQTLLENGRLVLNGGGYFSYRVQDMFGSYGSYGSTQLNTTATSGDNDPMLTHIGAKTFTFDGWGQLRWRGLRVELEAALIAGSIDNIDVNASYQAENYKILSLGSALEFEYRLVHDKLGIYFDTGLATGDSDVEGLSSVDDLVYQQHKGKTVSTFRFSPAYRIDMVLWRSIMRQVTGAYYFKPGISYDFLRTPFGQLFGARLNVIWSRAAAKKQTWGDGYDLGVELNASLYWRSEDGPEPIDGFHAIVQWGMLFPLQGLGYTSADKPAGFDMKYPQNLRLVLGVAF